MVLGESLGFYDRVQVGTHQRSDEVEALKFVERFVRSEGIEQTNNVVVFHVIQKFEFAISSLGVSRRLKGSGQFFYRHLLVE